MENNSSNVSIPSGSIIMDNLIGSVMLTLSITFLILYAPIICIFTGMKEFRLNSCYLLMTSALISDIFNLIGWAVISIGLFGAIPSQVSSYALAVNALTWRNMGWHQTFIALNRYVSICHYTRYSTLFSRNRVRMMIIFAWTHSLLTGCIPSLIPPRVVFSTSGYYMAILNQKAELFYKVEDESMCMLFTLVCVTCYTAVLVNYHRVRRKVQQNQENQGVDTRQKSRGNTKRFRLAWQLFAVNFLYLIAEIGFFVCWWVPFDNNWSPFVLSTLPWILSAGSGAVIYLVCNEELKIELRKRMQCWQ